MEFGEIHNFHTNEKVRESSAAFHKAVEEQTNRKIITGLALYIMEDDQGDFSVAIYKDDDDGLLRKTNVKEALLEALEDLLNSDDGRDDS